MNQDLMKVQLKLHHIKVQIEELEYSLAELQFGRIQAIPAGEEFK